MSEIDRITAPHSTSAAAGKRVYFDAIIERFRHAVAATRNAARALDHPGLAGTVREIALSDCLSPYLTHSFKSGTGKIVDTTGFVTKQIDLVIYQTKLAPPLMISKDLGVFPAECCAYAIEVKSTLTASELRRALDIAESVSRLRRFPRLEGGKIIYENQGPATMLFAFGSDIIGSEIERYLQYDGNPNPRFSALFVAGKGYWFYDSASRQWLGASCIAYEQEEAIFAVFVAGLTNTLVVHEATLRGFNPGSYILFDNLPILERHNLPESPQSSST